MELWTKQHEAQLLPSMIVMFIIAIVLRLTLGKKDLKIRMIPFQILAVFIVLLEVGKQVVSLKLGYNLYHLPFHFCSLFLSMLPLMAFYRGKHFRVVTGITTAIAAAMFLLTAIYPNLIYGGGNIDACAELLKPETHVIHAGDTNYYLSRYLDFHTVAFHNVVMLIFLVIAALDLHEPETKRDVKFSMLYIVGFCVVSASMAYILKTNYANFYTCNIAPLEAVRQGVENSIGRIPAVIFYVSVLSALNLAFVYGSYWFYRLCHKLLKGKKTDKVAA